MDEDLVERGSTADIIAIDASKVMKIPPWSNNRKVEAETLRLIETEKKIYKRLGSHPQICRYLGPALRGFYLERMRQTLRQRLSEDGPPPEHLAWRWSLQAALGLAYIHSKNVV